MIKILIDPGHSPQSTNRGLDGYLEHVGAWKISTYLKEILETKKDVKVDFTRTREENPELEDRGRKAQGYDLFISQHSNANNGIAKGVEVFRDHGKMGDNAFGQELAEKVSKVMGTLNRGVKTRTFESYGKLYNYYGVIRGAAQTNCKHIFIIESGFHDNVYDAAILNTDVGLKRIAEAQAEVICKYLNIQDKEIIDMERYKKIEDVPEYFQTKVKEWTDKGILIGDENGDLNISLDMIRNIMIVERMLDLKLNK